MTGGLERYREKRDFQRTPEPPPVKGDKRGTLLFVIQKHRARQLHYDFRLEWDGALKSWSVPKGPSLDPAVKHLAVMVEDHPLDYGSFEGNIPKGEYGAGEVIVWDTGAYSPDEGGKLLFTDRAAAEAQMREGLAKGKLSFTLRGSKLKGSWTLVKIKSKANDWLLMKHRDEHASPDTDILKEDRSALSGRTVEDIRAGKSADKPAAKPDLESLSGAKRAAFPDVISPMLASLTEKPFSNKDWLFEPKLDGYRILAYLRSGEVALLTRNGINVNLQYASLIPEMKRLPASELVLDGELIAMDEKGQQCFQCLQDYSRSLRAKEGGAAGQYPLLYYIFDILYLDGFDLRSVPLRSRKELLHSVLKSGGQVRLTDYFEADGEAVYQAAVANGLEGIIAKRADSLYESGKRSKNWLKVKAVAAEEFVIGGYSVSDRRASTFSSLLLGYFDSKGKLIFAGHVGSGFDEINLADLKKRLDSLKIARRPFSEEPPLNAPTIWVKPELVAEVKFAEWTKDGRLRQPVFLRLRDDKLPAEIRRADPVIAPESLPQGQSNPNSALLEKLQNSSNNFTLDIDGAKIKLTNLDKVLWPETASHPPLTKRHLLTYLAEVSVYALPHLKDRPLTLTRYPDGIYGEHFYQKHWGHPVPAFVDKINIHEEKGSQGEYLLCNNLPTLIWLGQVANLELHSWFSRTSPNPDIAGKPPALDDLLEYPDFIIFDLDPYIYSGKEAAGAEPEYNREGFTGAVEVALWLKELLDELSLQAFIKTSGKTGLHIYLPIVRRLDYKAVRAAAEMIGRYLLQRHPNQITMEWAQEKRKGKVFVDYGQNVRGKTLASIYSPRPAPEASVSTPLRWEELGKVLPTEFTLLTLPERLKKTGDLWAGILQAKRDLSEIITSGGTGSTLLTTGRQA